MGDEPSRLHEAAPDLLVVARAYEKWEADLIMSDEAWDEGRDFPRIPEALWDRLLKIQALRNDAVRKATGEAK